MSMQEYKKNIDKNIERISKNINIIDNKVLELKKVQSTFIKIDKN